MCVRVNECGEVRSERRWCVCGEGESDGGDNVVEIQNMYTTLNVE